MEEYNEQNNAVVTDDEVQQPQEYNEVPQVDTAQVEMPQQAQSEKQGQWTQLREARERAERERDEAIRYIQQMQMQMQSSNNQNVPDDDNSVAPDDLVEQRHLKKELKAIKDQLRQYEAYTQTSITDARIKAQFRDFDNVVSSENVERLRILYPEIARSLHQTPDLYNKAVSTYNIIKKFGLNGSPTNEYEKSLAQKNTTKPRTSNSISPQQGESPLNRANEFANGFASADDKARLYKEMMEARRNY